MSRLALIVALALLGASGQLSAASLATAWPPSAGGRFDELGLRYRVGDRLVLLMGSRWCLVDGRMLSLSRAPVLAGDGIDVPDDLLAHLRVQQAVVPALPQPDRPLPVVVLDAGHGGKDPGAVGMGGLFEKDVTLDVARRVANLLKDKPLVLKMTRTTDEFVDLHERCDMSNRWKASVFVSVHCNAHASRGRYGAGVFRISERNKGISERADFTATRFPLPACKPTAVRGEDPALRTHEDLYRWKDRESLVLAKAVGQALGLPFAPGENQFEENFCVLRETMAPSALVEMDFISNPRIEVYMGLSDWRDRLAKSIADGILAYLGMGGQS